jgi:hypothetical protein
MSYQPSENYRIIGDLHTVALVLPASRSVQVGATATVFATMIAPGATAGVACSIAPRTSIPAAFQFQTTDPATNRVTGMPNTPVNIAPGMAQTFVLAISPTAPFPPTDVQLNFGCANLDPASVFVGGLPPQNFSGHLTGGDDAPPWRWTWGDASAVGSPWARRGGGGGCLRLMGDELPLARRGGRGQAGGGPNAEDGGRVRIAVSVALTVEEAEALTAQAVSRGTNLGGLDCQRGPRRRGPPCVTAWARASSSRSIRTRTRRSGRRSPGARSRASDIGRWTTTSAGSWRARGRQRPRWRGRGGGTDARAALWRRWWL